MDINKRREGTIIHEELCSLSDVLSSFCSEGHNDELNPLQEIFGTKLTPRPVFSEPTDVTDKPEEDKDTEDHCNKGTRAVKRTRSMDYRVITEKKRRQLIRDKVEILQEMTPNCSKADLATKLENIIEYIKSMKHQLDVMSMAYTEPAGYMPPFYGAQAPMMSPWGYYAPGIPMMPQQNMPFMPQYHEVQNTPPPHQTRPHSKPWLCRF